MKVVILCGGRGTRLAEETEIRPKPMVPIGGEPLLAHIMSTYAAAGFKEFLLALGYKGEMIKDYFLNYHARASHLTIDLRTGVVEAAPHVSRDWTVHLVDTGDNTMTGGRVYRLRDRLRETFMLTYGDGVSDLDVAELVAFHRRHGKLATLTAVRPPARFGAVRCEGDRVAEFNEKPQTGEGWINGGFFVFEPGIFEYLGGDDTVLEREPLEALARDGQLMAFRYDGFWRCMDTVRDRQLLEELWQSGAPWNHRP